MFLQSSRFTHFIPLATALLVAACSGEERQVSTKPSIIMFAATPIDVAAGGTSMLRWEVMGADSIQIDVVDGANVLPPTSNSKGSIVTPALTANTTFVLAAKSTGGTATAMLEVTVGGVVGGPQVTAFAANPATLAAPGMTTLNWQTSGGTSLQIEVAGTPVFTADATAVAQGSTMVQVDATTTYTLVVVDDMARTAQQTVTVTIGGATGPQVDSFTASPATVTPGSPSTLSWTVQNATTIDIRDSGGTVVNTSTQLTGTFAVTPAQTETYTLVAQDAVGGAATAMVTVTVNANPMGAMITSFAATPNPVPQGTPTTLAWTVTNAPEGIDIMESGAVIVSSMMATGTFMVTPTMTTDYLLVAKNAANGDAMQTITVTVNAANAPAITAFSAAPNPVASGAQTTLTWTTMNADRVRILDGATEVYSTMVDVATGNTTVTPTNATTTYTIEATLMGAMPATNTVDVYMHVAPVVNTFTVTPATLTAAGPVTVTWDVQNVSDLTLTMNGTAVAGFPGVMSTTGTTDAMGTLQVQVTQNSTFVLTATSLAGTLTPSAMVTLMAANGEVEPNDDFAQANPIPGGTITGALAANDLDFFMVTVPAGGSIRAETSDGMGGCATDTFMSLTGPGGNILAQDNDGGNGTCSLIDPAAVAIATDLVAGTYFIVVAQGAATAIGTYTLDVTVSPAQCGNNITETNANEQCDDNNTTANDGCSATCQLEIDPTVVTAPGQTVTLNFAATTSYQIIQVDIATAGQAISVTATDPGAATCNNVDTAVNIANAQLLAIGGKADGGPVGTAGTCAAILYPTDTFATNLAAGTYYVVVINQGGSGAVQVAINIQNPVCGNGAFETFSEQCDDGNVANNDGCSSTCTLEIAQTVTLPAASPIVVASSLVAGAFDSIEITVTAETFFRAETFGPNVAGGCNIETFILLYDSNQNLLAFDDEGGTNFCSLISETAAGARLAPGTYYLQVYEYSVGAIPAYEVRLESVAVPPNGPVYDLEPNDTQATAQVSGLAGAGTVTVHGRLTPEGDDDVWSFTVPANQTMTLTAQTHDAENAPTMCRPQNPVTDTRILIERAGLETGQPGTVEMAYNDDVDVANDLWCSGVGGVTVAGGTTGATYYVRVQGYADTGFRAYFLTMTLQ